MAEQGNAQPEKKEREIPPTGFPRADKTWAPQGFKPVANGGEMADHQHAVDIIADALVKTFPCAQCDILSSVYVHGGCCRDMFLNKVPNDVDLDLDTQRIQSMAAACTNPDCELKKFYDANGAEYERIGKILNFEDRLSQWMVSDKVINTRYLLHRIKNAQGVAGIKDNSKRFYVITFLIFCTNGIEIDIMDTVFYFDNRFSSHVINHAFLQARIIGNPLVMKYFMHFVVEALRFKKGVKGDERSEREKKRKEYFDTVAKIPVVYRLQEEDMLTLGDKKSRFVQVRKLIAKKYVKDEAMVFMAKYASSATAKFFDPLGWRVGDDAVDYFKKYPGLLEAKDLSADLPFEKVRNSLKFVLSFFPLIPTPWYPISHLCHSYQADCTFNGLYLKVKDIHHCNTFGDGAEATDKLMQHWKAKIEDPYTFVVTGDDEKGQSGHGHVHGLTTEERFKDGGIFDVEHGVVRTYEHFGGELLAINFTELVTKSQPEMILYRTVKNVSKLLDKNGNICKVLKEKGVKKIQIGCCVIDRVSKQLEIDVDGTSSNWATRITGFDLQDTAKGQAAKPDLDTFGRQHGVHKESEQERDRIARHIFSTYPRVNMKVRAAVLTVLGFSEAMRDIEKNWEDPSIEEVVESFVKQIDSYSAKQTGDYKGLKAEMDRLVDVLEKEGKCGLIEAAPFGDKYDFISNVGADE